MAVFFALCLFFGLTRISAHVSRQEEFDYEGVRNISQYKKENVTIGNFFTADETSRLLEMCNKGQANSCDDPSCKDEHFICTEETLVRLKYVQSIIKAMIDAFTNGFRTFFILLLFSIMLGQGIYLISVRHFHWKSLPFIGDSLVNDPCDGIPRFFRSWMAFLVFKVGCYKTYTPGNIAPGESHILYVHSSQLWPPRGVNVPDIPPDTNEWDYTTIEAETEDPYERLVAYYQRIFGKEKIKNFANDKYFQPPPKEYHHTLRSKYLQEIHEQSEKEPYVDYYFSSDESSGDEDVTSFDEWLANREKMNYNIPAS